MNSKKQLSILDFSRLTGIRRENLRFYDRIGLLSPEARGENNYRYYSRKQLNAAYLISSLRGIGMGIEEIKQYSTQRTPEKSLALFAQQDARIQTEIERLQEMRLIMKLYSDMVLEALTHAENALFLEEKPCSEPFFLCPPIPAHMNSDEGGIFSYEQAEASGVHLGYPQGTILAWEDIKSKSSSVRCQYYFKTHNGCNAHKPAGLYAVAYGRCDPWQSEPLYRRLLNYLETEHLRVCGDAYEEYPLGELAVTEVEQCCVRVEVPVVRVMQAP